MPAIKLVCHKLFRFCTRKIVFPLYYNLNTLKPLKENKVVFVELRLPELSNSFTEIYDYLTRGYNLELRTHFIKHGFDSNLSKYKSIFAFLKDAATAKYIIYNEASDIYGGMRKRKGAHMLCTWHGCGAFKKFGLSTKDKGFGDSGIEARLYPGHPDYDIVTVSSPEVTWAYIEAMGKESRKDCIKPTGVSRTDAFYRKEFIDKAYDKLKKEVPKSAGKKVMLYAPTFRGETKTARTPEELDIGMMYERFANEYVLLIKNHPIVHNKLMIPDEYKDFAFDVSKLLTTEEVICVADICISDYSSLIYEYSIFERPMAFFAFDLDDYFDNRGFYYDYDELTPGPVCRTNEELADAITDLMTDFEKSKYKEKIRGFREKFMCSCDGHATERIVHEFFGNDIEKYKRRNK
ncbi:CDP-glycerol glycerophosphotransferase, TagB/SpsB family [Butyrivibrio sp. ob235]|uniref:CDP-glycerol glycerophosphotransferase family protein n=1 Tax=Butyrivibrio sp. ob235 TaxID=1761780 RepID=UPI0008CC8D58|nr:CDP-glycerol glycerophosphotransferase family protein [Butyrivibrio sp. ob235]SEL81734.1 CDP-glycerol glycerophosphotransferase, TagB/SpsB family [Butyrivibrio sp. ob235]